jgi:gas vesicle protein
MSQWKSDALFVLGFLSGLAAGAAAAAFVAPKSGPETRSQITERGLELKHRADDTVIRAQQVANETLTKVQKSAQDLIKRDAPRNSLDSAQI